MIGPCVRLLAVLANTLMLAWPMPVIAEDRVALPRGCTGLLTVQLENCTVLNHWSCEGQPEGAYWVATFDNTQTEVQRNRMNGLGFQEGHYSNGRHVIVISQADAEDYRTLMETGIDTYDYLVQLVGRTDETRTWGTSVLTGETNVIDGVLLHEVRSVSNFSRISGGTSQKIVMQHTMDGLPVWIPDRILGDSPDEVVKHFAPTDFIWPSEPGFMSVVPTSNCRLPLS